MPAVIFRLGWGSHKAVEENVATEFRQEVSTKKYILALE